ncbi:MAG: hypothetical protein K2I18_04275 [Paramuribaculum sp.]|nr:hypothetical protein [Paramuribaculum sp.]
MKLVKIFSAAILAVSALSSCSDSGYWDEAPLEQGLSFQCNTYNDPLSPGAAEIVIPLRRTVTAGAQTVNITFTPNANCPSDITVPSQVTFEDGKNTTEVVISIANAMPPTTYAGKLSFEADKSYAGISTVTLNCPVNYTWVSLGKGIFIDQWALDDKETEVEIMQAEGFQRWRVMQPYNEGMAEDTGDWGDWRTGKYPAYIEFWETTINGQTLLTWNAFSVGINYQAKADQPIGCYPPSALRETMENCRWYAPGYACLSPYYYVNGVGGWNLSENFGVIQIIFPSYLEQE